VIYSYGWGGMMSVEKVIEFFEDVYLGVSSLFRIAPENFIDWQYVVDNNTVVTKNGECISYICLDGYLGIVDDGVLEVIIQNLKNSTSNMFNSNEVELTFFFYRDNFTENQVNCILSPAYQAAKDMNLELYDVLDSKKEIIKKWTRQEKCWLAIKTNLNSLTKAELRDLKKNIKSIKNISHGMDSSLPILFFDIIYNKHKAVVDGLCSRINALDVYAFVEDIHNVIYILRTIIEGFTSPTWKPCLPGDRLYFRDTRCGHPQDMSCLFYPPLHKLLFNNGGGESIDASIHELHGRYFAPVLLTLMPQTTLPFSVFFGYMHRMDIPYFFAMRIQAGRLSQLNEKIATGLSFLPGSVNKQIVRAYEETREMIVEGELVAGVQIQVLTWAPSYKEAVRRSSIIAQAIQSWGSADASTTTGDPLYGLLSTMGVTTKMLAPTTVAPVSDLFGMAPVTRMVSPWVSGALVLRSEDGKVLPYQPGSSLQTSWVVMGFAPMGFGKSVFLNALNASLVLLEGGQKLPYISIIDIGVSSSGLISLIREALPENQQHLVQYIRLSKDMKHCINVFDTPLGMRVPTQTHRDFLVTFLSLICMSQREMQTYPNIDGLLRLVIDNAYESVSDNQNPKRFDINVCPLGIKKVLEQENFSFDSRTSWWEVVDFLYDARYYREALMAQRYAVPTLPDCASVSRQDSISSIYQDRTPGGVLITEYVWRQIIEAINKYPNISHPTQYDIGETRICSIDLNDVAPFGSEMADAQTAIMYLLARHVTCSRFFFTLNDLQFLDKKYHSYHKPRIEEMSTIVKAICYDEFHRTSRISMVRDQVVRDIREGRKWRILVSLFSQRVQDFDASMIDLATSIFILGGGSEEGLADLQDRFNLSDADIGFIRRITKPTEQGAKLLAIHNTAKGRVTQAAMLTLSPEELWAYTTNAIDRHVRDMLYKEINPQLARRVLAKVYPKGTIITKDKEFSEEDYKNIIHNLLREAEKIK
jgi:intracellular multiplication protein IcmB